MRWLQVKANKYEDNQIIKDSSMLYYLKLNKCYHNDHYAIKKKIQWIQTMGIGINYDKKIAT